MGRWGLQADLTNEDNRHYYARGLATQRHRTEWHPAGEAEGAPQDLCR